MVRSLLMSPWTSVNEASVTGLKHTPAWPVGTRPASVWSVMAALGRPNRASRRAGRGLFRPGGASKNLVTRPPLRRVPHLIFEAGELLQALLERRVRREQRGQAEPLRQSRCEEEGGERLRAAQVAGG